MFAVVESLPPIWVQVTGMVLVAVPATIMATASLMSSRKTRADIATNHGKRPGEYLELIHDNQERMADDLAEVRMWLVDHLRDREAHNYSP